MALRTALAEASEQESEEREEGGAGRTNVLLPKLPQERSVGTALSLVARCVGLFCHRDRSEFHRGRSLLS